MQDAVDGRSLADCSKGVLVKAMGFKDAQRVQGSSTAREDLIYMSGDLRFCGYPHAEEFQGLDALHPVERRHRPTHSSATYDYHLFGFTGVKS